MEIGDAEEPPVPANLLSSSGKANKEIEDCVLRILTDAALSFPAESSLICRNVSSQIGYRVSHTIVSNLLQKFAAQELIRYGLPQFIKSYKT